MDREEDLDSLGILYGTDKSSLGNGYLRQYARILNHVRDKAFTLLEIGIARGASLRMWEAYFPKATIVAVDIRPECKQYAGGRRIVEIGSQADPAFLSGLGEKYRPTVIIDDGSHMADHIFLTFQKLYPHLRAGGLYIVEDVQVHAGRFADSLLGTADMRPQQFFLQLANLVVSPLASVEFDRSISHYSDSVEFFYGGIVIRKKPAPDQDSISPRRAIVEQAAKPGIWSLFGMYILTHGGDITEAQQALRTAIELEPNEPSHYHRLSVVLERMGDVPGAVAAAKDAVRLHPHQPMFSSRLGELESKLNA